MMLRAHVVQREYSVSARPARTDDNGEEIPRSDRIATALHLVMKASDSKYPARLVDEDDGEVSAVVELGDASDEKFEEVSQFLTQAASW